MAWVHGNSLDLQVNKCLGKICSIGGQILFESEPLEAEPVEEINPESLSSASSALSQPAGGCPGDVGAYPSGYTPLECPDLRAPPGGLGEAFKDV